MRIGTRSVRTGTALIVCLLLAVGLTACARSIPGSGAPALAGGGDFPSATASTPDPGSTGSPSETSTDQPGDTPSDTGTPGESTDPTAPPTEDGSVQKLCSDMSDTLAGPDLGAQGYQALIGLDILGWGLGGDLNADPFETVDAVTIAACPDVRTAVLAKTQTPDLKSLDS